MRKWKCLLFAICACCLLGCSSSSVSKTFSTSTDDQVKITLSPSKGYTIDGTIDFSIKKGKDAVAHGIFQDGAMFDTYKENLKNAEIISKGTKNGNEYIAWSGADGWNAIIKLRKTDHCLIISDTKSEENLKQILEIMNVSISEK